MKSHPATTLDLTSLLHNDKKVHRIECVTMASASQRETQRQIYELGASEYIGE